MTYSGWTNKQHKYREGFRF